MFAVFSVGQHKNLKQGVGFNSKSSARISHTMNSATIQNRLKLDPWLKRNEFTCEENKKVLTKNTMLIFVYIEKSKIT